MTGDPLTMSRRLVKKLDCYQRTHAAVGFLLGTVKKFGEDEAGNLAALISYYAFFSLFPLLLALVTVLGFVLQGNPELQYRIVDSALAQFPVVGDQIRSNIGSLSGNWLALLAGLTGAVWAGLGAVDAAQNALNAVWDVPIRERPTFLARKLRSFLMLVVIGSGLFLTAAWSAAANSVDSIGVVGPLLSALVNIGVFVVAFRILTDRDLRWSDVAPGAVVAGLAVTVLQVAGGFIVARSLRGASGTYGTFAVVIGLLSWLHLQARVTLFAAEMNVVRARRLWPRSLDEKVPVITPVSTYSRDTPRGQRLQDEETVSAQRSTAMDRAAVTSELQPLLIELVDLGLTAKQAHWNVTGPLFRPLHAQLDELADDARAWADQVAERVVALGVPSDGRIETVAAQTPLPGFPDGFVEDSKVVVAIVSRLDEIIERTRSRIDRLGDVDLGSQDMVIAIATGLDKHRWMFAAQQQ